MGRPLAPVLGKTTSTFSTIMTNHDGYLVRPIMSDRLFVIDHSSGSAALANSFYYTSELNTIHLFKLYIESRWFDALRYCCTGSFFCDKASWSEGGEVRRKNDQQARTKTNFTPNHTKSFKASSRPITDLHCILGKIELS